MSGMMGQLLVGAGIGAAFALATLVAARVGQVYAVAALFATAWVLRAGGTSIAVLDGALPALVAVLAVDAVRLTSPIRLAVVGLAPQDRRGPVELLAEHHPRQLVG